MCNNNFPHSLVCARAGYSGYRPGRGDMRYKLAGACVLAYLHAERNNSSSNSHVRTRTSSGLRAKTGTSRRRSGKHENESECELLFCSGRFIDRLCFPDGIATTPHACLGAVPFLRCTQRAVCKRFDDDGHGVFNTGACIPFSHQPNSALQNAI